jgi:hypothetical protein
MSDAGKNIASGFRELRKFYRETSLLLGTAAGRMKNAGWDTAKPVRVFRPVARITASSSWLPYEFCRFFQKSEHPSLLPFVVVIVDCAEENLLGDCALVSAGCLAFQAGKKPDIAKYRWARWHLHMGKQRKDDGKVCIDDRQEMGGREEGDHNPTPGLLSVRTFAYPLGEITDSDTLRDKIVEPLLRVIEQQAVGSVRKGKSLGVDG